MGDRVAYAMARGSYAEYAIRSCGAIGESAGEGRARQAAAAMLQGMTAHYLTHSTFPLKQARLAWSMRRRAALGWLIVQMAKMRGAHVIGTGSTEVKPPRCARLGATK